MTTATWVSDATSAEPSPTDEDARCDCRQAVERELAAWTLSFGDWLVPLEQFRERVSAMTPDDVVVDECKNAVLRLGMAAGVGCPGDDRGLRAAYNNGCWEAFRVASDFLCIGSGGASNEPGEPSGCTAHGVLLWLGDVRRNLFGVETCGALAEWLEGPEAHALLDDALLGRCREVLQSGPPSRRLVPVARE